MSSQVSRNGTASAVPVGTSSVVVADRKASRTSVIVYNNHASQILYLGTTSGVTTSTGLPVAAGASRVFDDYNGVLYGIASGATTDVRVFEVF